MYIHVCIHMCVYILFLYIYALYEYTYTYLIEEILASMNTHTHTSSRTYLIEEILACVFCNRLQHMLQQTATHIPRRGDLGLRLLQQTATHVATDCNTHTSSRRSWPAFVATNTLVMCGYFARKKRMASVCVCVCVCVCESDFSQ